VITNKIHMFEGQDPLGIEQKIWFFMGGGGREINIQLCKHN